MYPTQIQIETATRNVRYCDILNPVNRSCPISLETFNDTDIVSVIRFCGHIFKQDQLNTWFRTNCRCPVCRYDIRNYNSPSNASEFFEQNNNEEIHTSDASNNLTNENVTEQPLETNSNPNNLTSYLDIILENTFNDSSDTTNANRLLSLFNAIQRMQ